MQITDIQPQKKQKNRLNIWIDGSFAFGIAAKDAAILRLHIHQELSEQQLNEIKQTVVLAAAKETALRLLSQRDYSTKMMSEKLSQKEVPEDIVNQVIAFLQEYHYLDDEAYAGRYVKYFGESRGKHRLRRELFQKGISQEIVEALLSELSQIEDLYRMAERKFQALPPDYQRKDVERLKNFFLRRGFSYDEINDCFQKLTKEWE